MKTKPATLTASLVVMMTLAACTAVTRNTIVNIGARRATIAAIQAKPEYRPAFVASVLAIDTILANPDATRTDIEKVLQTLPIKGLTGTDISDIIRILEGAISDTPIFGQGLSGFRNTILAANNGMREGLTFSAVVLKQ